MGSVPRRILTDISGVSDEAASRFDDPALKLGHVAKQGFMKALGNTFPCESGLLELRVFTTERDEFIHILDVRPAQGPFSIIVHDSSGPQHNTGRSDHAFLLNRGSHTTGCHHVGYGTLFRGSRRPLERARIASAPRVDPFLLVNRPIDHTHDPGEALKLHDDIHITDEYQRVKDLINAATPVVFVTGKAGTGKSTLIHHLRDHINGNCIVLAPTGVAALNIQGQTIHSFFRFPPKMLTDNDTKAMRYSKPYEKIDLLIIDEISMVRADVLDAIDRFMRLNGPHRDLPFGGVQIVLVGDLHQLPPVVASRDEAEHFKTAYDSPFFFSSRVIRETDVIAVELTEVFRQKDDRFVDILNEIRTGEPDTDALESLNERVTPTVNEDKETVLSTTNMIADRINKSRMAALPTDAQMYVGAKSGTFALSEGRLPSPVELLLKKHARVMFTKNDPDGRWVNGSLGVVKKLTKKYIRVKLDDGDTVDVEKAKWETYRYEFDADEEKHVPVVTGSFKQLPLTPAWAITIHKSQGKTLSAARIDLGRSAFAAGQVYVALSRCRRLQDVTLSRAVSPDDVFVDGRVRRFCEAMMGTGD